MRYANLKVFDTMNFLQKSHICEIQAFIKIIFSSLQKILAPSQSLLHPSQSPRQPLFPLIFLLSQFVFQSVCKCIRACTPLCKTSLAQVFGIHSWCVCIVLFYCWAAFHCTQKPLFFYLFILLLVDTWAISVFRYE